MAEKEYIEREAVLNHADIITVHTREYGSIDVIPVDCVSDIPAADVAPKAEWISVEERLPDDNSRCLAWSAYYNDWMARFSVYERKTNKWYVVCGGRLRNTAEDSVKVTHWMPLPEPPVTKGEKHDPA